MRLPILLAALLLLASGCSGPEDAAADVGAAGGPGGGAAAGAGAGAPGQPGAAPAVEEVLYESTELITGASPTPPLADGAPAPWPVPPAKVDTFTVADGTLELEFEGGVCDGSGFGQVEVLGPDGAAVWTSDFARPFAGAPGVGCAGLYSAGEGDGNDPAPGEYTVNYWIAGALTATLKVTAELPAPAAATADA